MKEPIVLFAGPSKENQTISVLKDTLDFLGSICLEHDKIQHAGGGNLMLCDACEKMRVMINLKVLIEGSTE